MVTLPWGIKPHVQQGTSGLGYLNPLNYDLGVSEAFQLGSGAGRQLPLSSQGGSDIFPNSRNQILGASVQEQNYSYDPSIGNASFDSPAATGGGGGGGTGSGGGTGTTGGAPLEETPSAPDFSIYDEAYAQGESALNQAQQAAQQGIQTALGEAEASGQQRSAQAQAAQKEKLGALGQQRTRESQRAENAISEARRQAAELQQGLQARYGRTTGTGAFAGELLGRSAMQNIGATRQALQNTMSQIGAAENRVREETSRLLDQIETDTQFAKERARNTLAQVLADIAGKKGELQQAKADRRMAALQDYQNLVASINARNTAYKQELYNRAQRTSQALDSFRNQAMEQFQTQFQNFTPPTFQVGDQTIAAFPTGSNLRGVTYMSGDSGSDEELPSVTEGSTEAALGL